MFTTAREKVGARSTEKKKKVDLASSVQQNSLGQVLPKTNLRLLQNLATEARAAEMREAKASSIDGGVARARATLDRRNLRACEEDVVIGLAARMRNCRFIEA